MLVEPPQRISLHTADPDVAHGYLRTEPFGYLLMGQVFSGTLRLSTGRDELHTTGNELFMLDPAAPMRIEWADFRAGLVRLPGADLTAG